MECENCKYYDNDEGYCTAMICTPISCDEVLPCEETDAVTLYAEGSMDEEDFNRIFDDPDFGNPG